MSSEISNNFDTKIWPTFDKAIALAIAEKMMTMCNFYIIVCRMHALDLFLDCVRRMHDSG